MTLSTSPYILSGIHNGTFYFDSVEASAPRFEVRLKDHVLHLKIVYNSSLCEKIETLFKDFKAEVNEHFHSPKCRMCRKEYNKTPSILKTLEYIRSNNTFIESAHFDIEKLIHQCRLDG